MLPSFYGLSHEETYRHLDEFLEICSTVKIHNFDDDALRLTLFSFSLKDKAKYWLKSLDSVEIGSWDQLQQEFLRKYFPIDRMNQYRRVITSFSELDGEQFHETWERMKDLLRKCPHHQVPRWQLVQSFYDGLSDRNRQMIDSSCGGTFMLKSEDEAWRLFDTLTENSLHHASSSHSDRATPSIQKKGGVLEIGSSTALQCEVDMIAQKMDQLLAGPSPTQQVCTLCASPAHEITECPSAAQYPEFVQEQVQAAQGYARPQNNPFSSTYNPGWRNHPNFSWKKPQSSIQMSTSSQPARPPAFTQTFQRPSYPQTSSSFRMYCLFIFGFL